MMNKRHPIVRIVCLALTAGMVLACIDYGGIPSLNWLGGQWRQFASTAEWHTSAVWNKLAARFDDVRHGVTAGSHPQVVVQQGAAPDTVGGRLGEPLAELPHGYRYSLTDDDGEPILANSCQPISYAIEQPASDTEQGMIQDAVHTVSSITGLQFVQVDHAGNDSAADTASSNPSRTQFQFRFLSSEQHPEFAVRHQRQILGTSQVQSLIRDDGHVLAIGSSLILLNEDYFGAYTGGWFDDYARHVGIIEHEIAHSLGLDHSDEPGSFMAPVAGHAIHITDTDRQALTALVRECMVP